MGKTSTAIKNRYNAKAYDNLQMRIYAGTKEQMQAAAAKAGQSLAQYILEAVASRMQAEGQPLQLRKWNDEAEN